MSKGEFAPFIEGLVRATELVLKPCPFCGSVDINTYEPTIYEVGNDASVRCQDPSCGVEVRAPTLKMAVAKWNRRAKE